MTQAIQFKGSMFTLTILQVLADDITKIGQQIKENMEKAPKFFTHAPIVIDITNIDVNADFLDQIIHKLRSNDLIPIGLISSIASLQHHAIAKGLAIFPKSKQTTTIKKEEKPVETQPAESENKIPEQAKIILQPVRSGQQIYAKNTDLVILNSVSPGAEVIADGNIHIYGALHGRALAGVNGNNKARIFCHTLDAELVSISGLYQLSDDFAQYKKMNGLQIYLDDEKLCIEKI